ncbi:hypothetical protein IX51_08095 [uncultured archaeon]|nr:hypothetical protein IX51_08095 [uncultured archaeon]HKJ96885.1 hypothetical protein [Thermoplasmataceae archaeon]
MKSAIREFQAKDVNLDTLSELIVDFFKEEGFRTQTSKHPHGTLIQARKGGVMRTLLAMDRALTVVIQGDHNDFKIRIGVGKWLKNLGVASIEAFFLSPMVAFIEVPEALWSYEIEHHLWHYIETQIDLGIQ